MTKLLTVEPGITPDSIAVLEPGYSYPLLRCRTLKELAARTRSEPQWTVKWENHPVAFFAVHRHLDPVPDSEPEEQWYETVIHVDPAFRGNGVASAVTIATAEWFARQTIPVKLLVDVNTANLESVKAHRKMLPGYPVVVNKQPNRTYQWQLPKHPVIFLQHPAYSYRLAEQLHPQLDAYFPH